MSFSQLRISSDILKGLKDFSIEAPSSLQKKVIHTIQDGKHLLIKASESFQPEAAFLVPVLDHIARQERRQGTKAVILTSPDHVRSLEEWVRNVSNPANIEIATIIDGGEKDQQRSALSAGPTLIIATPARLAELMEENRMIFRETKYLVIDRADEIEEWDSVDIISKRIISKCQHLLSVLEKPENLPPSILSFLNEPVQLGFDEKKKKSSSASENGSPITQDLTQYYIKVPPRMKISTLMEHLEQTPTDTVLIFTASRRTADRLYRVFRKSGRRAVSIHNGIHKNVFDERLERFNRGNVQHLIAGEVSASELPIDQVTQVINYDVPEEVGEYKLRAEIIGDGKATRIVSLVSKQDRSDIKEIIESLGYAPEEIPLPEGVKQRKSRSGKENRKRPAKRSGQKTGHKKSHSRNKPSKKAPRAPMGLPRPSYDKLSRGRSGEKEKESSGIVNFFKKLFT